MPTAAKLISALWFALIGWLAANAHIPAIPGGVPVGYFREITAGIGLAVGWIAMGSDVGRGYVDSISGGLKTSIIIVFISLMIFAGGQMIRSSMRQHYDGPMEALLQWIKLMAIHAYSMLTVGVLGVLIVGGIVGGLLAEYVSKHFR